MKITSTIPSLKKALIVTSPIYKSQPYYLFKPVFLGGLLSLALALVQGCSNANENTTSHAESTAQAESAVSDYDVEPPDTDVGLTVENLSQDTESSLGSQAADIKIAGKQLLISATANFKVADVVASTNKLETLTREQGGYIASSRISSHQQNSQTYVRGDKDVTLITYYRKADMVLRIPSAKVSAFLRQAQNQVVFLQHQEFSAKDVTLDLYREQLAVTLNKEMAEALSEERLNSKNEKEQAGNIDAITANFAARQRQEYAKLERMNMADQVKYSTIHLTFAQPSGVYKEITKNIASLVAEEELSFSQQFKQSLKQGWHTFQHVVLRFILLWWLWLLIGLLYLSYRFLTKLKPRRPKPVTKLNQDQCNKNSTLKNSSFSDSDLKDSNLKDEDLE